MAGKVYNVLLKVDKESCDFLKNCCVLYHKIFNTAIEVQFKTMTYGTTYEEQLMSAEKLLEVVYNRVKNFKNYKALEEGIIKRAVLSSNFYFHKWWHHRMTTNDNRLPSHMKSKDHFSTSTSLKVSKGGYIYFPKFKRIKIVNGTNIPVSSYNNVTVSNEGKKWYVSLEGEVEVHKNDKLSGNLEISIDSAGNVSFEEVSYPNITKNSRFKEALQELKVNLKKIKRQAIKNTKKNMDGRIVTELSNQMKKRREKIQKIHVRLNNLKKEYFKSIVRDIISRKPSVIIFIYSGKGTLNLNSSFLKNLGTLDMIKMIRAKSNSMNFKIKYSDGIKF